jgi:hypothetical protein
VVSQTFGPGGGSSSPTVQVPQNLLPPGLNKNDLPQRATAVTAAGYRARPGSKPVGVTVLATRGRARRGSSRRFTPPPPALGASSPSQGSIAEGSAPGREAPTDGDTIAAGVARATGGDLAGVRVQSPKGGTYVGTRIRSPQVLVYILDEVGANITIIIYAPDPSEAEVATRLAGNVGNGAGIADDPEMQGAIGALPAAPGDDLTLQSVNTMTPADLGISEADLKAASEQSGKDGAAAQEMVSTVRQFMPTRFTTATYRDREQREWNAIACDFGETRRAWNTWWLLRWTLTASGMHPVSMAGGEGQYADADKQRILIFQKGPYLVFLSAPAAAALERQTHFADGFQM